MIGRSNHDVQSEKRGTVSNIGTSSDKTSNQTQVNSPQVDMHTIEVKIVSKERSEVDNVKTTVETKVLNAVLTAILNLVIPRVELALKTANASSGRSVDGNVNEPDHRVFPDSGEGLQISASSRIH